MLAIVSLSLSVGAATDEERLAARSLAQTGVSAFQEGRYSDAVDSLSRAEELIHSPVHLLYIARAQAQLGQLLASHESYLKVTKEPLTDRSPAVFTQAVADATNELEALRPRIPKITVVVNAPEGLQPTLTVDGSPVASALIGVPWPIDPGQHEITAAAEGAEPSTQTVVVAEGAQQNVEFTLTALPQAGPTSQPASTAPADRVEPETDPTMTYVAYGSLGVGVVGVALGTFMLVDGLNLRSDSDDLFDECNPSGCSNSQIDEIDRLGDDSAGSLTWSAVGYTVGGLGVAAGVTLLLLDTGDGGAEQATEPQVRPWVGVGAAGISGRF
jgi:hypothetical protein